MNEENKIDLNVLVSWLVVKKGTTETNVKKKTRKAKCSVEEEKDLMEEDKSEVKEDEKLYPFNNYVEYQPMVTEQSYWSPCEPAATQSYLADSLQEDSQMDEESYDPRRSAHFAAFDTD